MTDDAWQEIFSFIQSPKDLRNVQLVSKDMKERCLKAVISIRPLKEVRISNLLRYKNLRYLHSPIKITEEIKEEEFEFLRKLRRLELLVERKAFKDIFPLNGLYHDPNNQNLTSFADKQNLTVKILNPSEAGNNVVLIWSISNTNTRSKAGAIILMGNFSYFGYDNIADFIVKSKAEYVRITGNFLEITRSDNSLERINIFLFSQNLMLKLEDQWSPSSGYYDYIPFDVQRIL